MKKIIYVLISCSLVVGSCAKFLDKKPDDTLTTPTNLSALQAILDHGQYMNGSSPSSSEASADDYYLLQSTYNTRTPIVQNAYLWNLLNHSDYTFSYVKDWSNLYFTVYNANLCLSEIEKIPRNSINSNSWNNIKGSALFFRARAFLQLAWVYCNAYDEATGKQEELGVVLRTGDDFNVKSVRSSVSDTYLQIIRDFSESIQYLPSYTSIQLRPSKAAAYGYLSRTYWSMRKYDSAFKYANVSLEINNTLMNYNNEQVVKISNKFPFEDLNVEVIHQCYIYGASFNSISQANARIDTSLFNSYDDNDLRKHSFFEKSTDGIVFKGNYTGRSSLFTGIATDEIYLIRAECNARKGNVSAAMEDLNTLLITRWKAGTFIPYTATSSEEALQIILRERRKELVFRDLRWIDIKRLNKEAAGISIRRIIDNKENILLPNANKFAIPLPTDIIILTGLPQNPQ